MLYFTAFPLICYGVHFAGRYFFFFDFFLDIGLLAAVIFTAIFCISDPKARFVLLVSAGSFVVFMIPLFAVTPIGPRNAYFFEVLFILITMILFHQATNNWKEMQQIAPALVLASCLLLFGNLWIHYRNGSTEQIRVQITSEAMKR
ncbi:MAG: hypothetical protein IIY70_00540, partial [Oscillospiraceae bacterium]|nr:hypothetical protein [Oscillospiraceae bacterium]